MLEPLQANPTIIEDNCFIGARSEIVEGVVVGEYVNAGGVRTYYETHGEGEPLVLLHGGLATAESWATRSGSQRRSTSKSSWGSIGFVTWSFIPAASDTSTPAAVPP